MDLNKTLAFVIEDDKYLASAFGDALSEAGFEVELIYDGKSALERLSEVVPKLVILDLHLPSVRGSQVLDYIRTKDDLENVRVVVATADNITAQMLGDKVDLVLVKPIRYWQLRDLSARLKATE